MQFKALKVTNYKIVSVLIKMTGRGGRAP